MKINRIKAREQRILRAMNFYHPIEDAMSSPAPAVQDKLAGLGALLGFYENSPAEQVFISEEGIVVSSEDAVERIRFADIATTNVVGENKHAAEFIDVTDKSGRNYTVPIRHGDGRLRDIWEFYRFLNRTYTEIQQIRYPDVTADLSTNRQPSNQ